MLLDYKPVLRLSKFASQGPFQDPWHTVHSLVDGTVPPTPAEHLLCVEPQT